ncbi:MAG: hypothetical protein QM647_12985 [Asticcacaulis sp.]|uniref:hypothetical protein n=1 Tax=Asticcacaulis sp. TaxID=1872648 RepID=UPI0039E4BBF2
MSDVSKSRPAAAWWRLLAASVFTAVPAIGLPSFISHLYRVRPHVTDAPGGYVLPHYRDGVTWYFAHADETLIKGLSFWLLAGVILLMFVGGQMLRRPLKQWLRRPHSGDDQIRT